MDLFATRHNHKLPLFVSPVPDPLAWEVEALHLDWTGLLGYAYLVQLSIQVPRLLKQPTPPVFHDNPEHLNLHARNLGHNPSKGRASMKRWQIELLNLRDLPRERCTTTSGPYLLDGAKTIRWTSPECL